MNIIYLLWSGYGRSGILQRVVPPAQNRASENLATPSKLRSWRWAILGAAILMLFGCTAEGEPTESPIEPISVEADQASDVVAAAAEEELPAELDTPSADQAASDEEEAQPEEEAAEEPAPPSRDLASELRAAVGTPIDCLQDYRPSTPTTVRVSINALVRPTGLVIEPSASGVGLSYNDRKCIEQRVSDVVLAPLSTQTSQSVSTYVDLRFEPPEVEEENVGAPAPKLKDVVEPLPKKKTIPKSGVPIQKAPSDKIAGPKGVPIEGPKGVPVEGPKPEPIEGYEVDEGPERWTE